MTDESIIAYSDGRRMVCIRCHARLNERERKRMHEIKNVDIGFFDDFSTCDRCGSLLGSSILSY